METDTIETEGSNFGFETPSFEFDMDFGTNGFELNTLCEI